MDPRETYEKLTGLSIDSTYSEIMNIEGWDGGEELTWAEWGYVNWLEAQNAKLVEALETIMRLYGRLETESGIDYTMVEEDLNREVRKAKAQLAGHRQ